MIERLRKIAREFLGSSHETERNSEITDIHRLVRPVIAMMKNQPLLYSGADHGRHILGAEM